jgi:hypothetical protein
LLLSIGGKQKRPHPLRDVAVLIEQQKPTELLVAFLAGSRSFFTIGVAALAVLVSPVLAETLDFAGTLLVALLAVANGSLMGLVVEFHTFFQFHDVSGKSGSGECYECNHGDNRSFHFLPLLSKFCQSGSWFVAVVVGHILPCNIQLLCQHHNCLFYMVSRCGDRKNERLIALNGVLI